jgi:hypothetical protein
LTCLRFPLFVPDERTFDIDYLLEESGSGHGLLPLFIFVSVWVLTSDDAQPLGFGYARTALL